MWQIKERFDDSSQSSGKGMTYLKADQPMSPSHLTYPITWTGFISNKRVEIIQLDSSAISLDDFTFQEFPEQYTYLKSSIIDWIHNYLRILN